jgi:adenine-specific DNA glycosylase
MNGQLADHGSRPGSKRPLVRAKERRHDARSAAHRRRAAAAAGQPGVVRGQAAAFPVDTHVHRIAARLGWIPPGITAEKAYRILAQAVPPDIRYDLHMALIAHGRTVCQAQRPRCGTCVLRDGCAYG